MGNKYLLTVVVIVAALVVGLFVLAFLKQNAAATSEEESLKIAAKASDTPTSVPISTLVPTTTPSPTATQPSSVDTFVWKTATAEAQATETATAGQHATAEAQATGTALAEAGATATAQVTETAIVAGETTTAEVSLTKTASAIEEATAEAHIVETAQAEASATAAARATETASVQQTATAAAIPPTPIPDALIDAPEGFVRLWSGPGMEVYDSIVLPNETKLDVLRRVVNKPDWLKVAANSDSAEAVEGYVNITSGLIEINVDVDEIPAIYEYGPRLLEPKRYDTRGVDALIEFSWEPAGLPLGEDQFYSVILVRDDLTDADACYHWQTKDTKLSFKPADYGCTAGDYHWGVGLATIIGREEDGRPIWRDDSQRDERNPIGIGVPHSGKPSGSEGRGGGSGGEPPTSGTGPK